MGVRNTLTYARQLAFVGAGNADLESPRIESEEGPSEWVLDAARLLDKVLDFG
jgi:hypothetical protein